MIYNLKQLVNIKYGKNQKKVEDPNGEYPIYGTGGLIAYSNEYLYSKPSVLIGRKGTINKVKFIKEPFWAVDTLFYTEINEELVTPEYLYYKMLIFNLNDYNEGTTVPSLRAETLYRIELEIPDKNIQYKTIELLRKVDEKIELNNQINNNLFEFASNYMDSKLLDEFVPISTYCRIQGGYAFKSKDFIDDKTKNRVIKIKNLRNEINVDVINSQFIVDDVANKIDKKFILTAGNVVIAMTGAELGKTGFIYGKGNYYLNQRVGVIKGHDYKSELFLNIYCLSKSFQQLLNSKGYGSAQPNISTNDIENILINKIEGNCLDDVYLKLGPIYKRIINNCEENLNLEQLRDTLLPKLMNGEIDLDKIEI